MLSGWSGSYIVSIACACRTKQKKKRGTPFVVLRREKKKKGRVASMPDSFPTGCYLLFQHNPPNVQDLLYRGRCIRRIQSKTQRKKKDGRWATSPIFISLMFSFSSLMSSSLFLEGGREREGGHSGLPGSPDWLQMMNGIVYIFCGIRLLLIWQS